MSINSKLPALLAAAILAGRAFRRRYDLVHVHNMPDVLVFSALVPKLFGAKIILDLNDPMPELMMTIFRLREETLLVRLLKKFEAWSILFADAVLTTNEAFRKLFVSRSCPAQRIEVIMNSPDEEIFQCHESELHQSASRESSNRFVRKCWKWLNAGREFIGPTYGVASGHAS
jgi:glycosyltransferase involved in cell wall biosynthesis